MEAGDSQPEREPLVSAIVVSYNVKDLLLDCLAALFEGTDVPLEVIVVDNNSRDGSAAAVEAEFPQVKVHRMRKNVGFGKANNVGLEMATGRFVLILNPDVMLVRSGPGWCGRTGAPTRPPGAPSRVPPSPSTGCPA
jgi:GT2 family glycosyltransferase